MLKLNLQSKVQVHLKQAAALIQLISKYQSDITITNNKTTVNAKTMINILTANINANDLIQITVSGPDETTAIQAIKSFFTVTA